MKKKKTEWNASFYNFHKDFFLKFEIGLVVAVLLEIRISGKMRLLNSFSSICSKLEWLRTETFVILNHVSDVELEKQTASALTMTKTLFTYSPANFWIPKILIL